MGWADCTHDYRADKKSGLMIADFDADVSGNISSSLLLSIKSKLIGTCIEDNEERVLELVTSLFQNEGYFAVKGQITALKTVDPLALPKSVTVASQITPGQVHRLADIKFVGNHAVPASRLRKDISLRKGDIFKRDKVASSLQSLRKTYAPLGFADMYFMPDTDVLSDATVNLTLTFVEGPQYHMGKFKAFARKDQADRFAAAWHLPEGAVFDFDYPDRYLDSNKDLLPSSFIREQLQIVRNCPEATAEVRLILDQTDPALPSLPGDVPCKE